MKKVIGFLCGFFTALFVGWAGGTDLDHRSVELGQLLVCCLVFGGLGAMSPFAQD